MSRIWSEKHPIGGTIVRTLPGGILSSVPAFADGQRSDDCICLLAIGISRLAD
jgi:hypothetical protein